ncbi:MAG: DUF4185 domain-containing protein [Gammaproteobacteria bacterium]|nr:DUF4185 domain-containing protein [Gammaproteobacteria bacterium]
MHHIKNGTGERPESVKSLQVIHRLLKHLRPLHQWCHPKPLSALVCAILLFCMTLPALAQAPYPRSSVITGIEWGVITITKAPGSDNWPLTWVDDGALYTAFGDGWGFETRNNRKLSLGLARIQGPAHSFVGENISSPSGEQKGDGKAGKKASGLLMVDGVLYMWTRNADQNGRQCQLAWSEDNAQSWQWSTWKFAEFGYCAFLNFGMNYSDARDQYVYTYSPDTPSAYRETDTAVLARVPRHKVAENDAYEFFVRVDANGKAIWTNRVEHRGAVFRFPGGVNRLDVTFNAPLNRYLLTLRSRARAGGVDHFGIYDAPTPWGPWTTVFFTHKWDVDPGESQHIPSKWISTDGHTLYLVFSGNDSFSVRKAVLTVAPR